MFVKSVHYHIVPPYYGFSQNLYSNSSKQNTLEKQQFNFQKETTEKILLIILDDVFPERTNLYKLHHFDDLVLKIFHKTRQSDKGTEPTF